MKLTTAQLDRACGVLLATAAGDALGAPYEFGPPLGSKRVVAMGGGGGWEPGEWTDDTSMAIAIAEVAATGADLRTETAQDAIVARWYNWALDAKDVGILTRQVLGAAGQSARAEGLPDPLARHARQAAQAHHRETGRSGGNGSLMRTAPVALAYLDDKEGLIQAATALSALTHFDPEAGEACVLWCLAIRHAVRTGKVDLRRGLECLSPERRGVWSERIDEAEAQRPADFGNNGWVVEAFQGAWSAIAGTSVPTDDPIKRVFRADRLRLALDAAVRGGRDADTVAAIAGGLLGATYGASAVPADWRRIVHGWPGLPPRELVALTGSIVRHGEPDPFDGGYAHLTLSPTTVRHPYDDGVWLAGVGGLRPLRPDVDAVVSLCRVGQRDLPPSAELVEVRLIDSVGPIENQNLDFVLYDTVSLIEQLRREGRTVLVHCVQAQSRTPTVAALYGARRRGVSTDIALAAVQDVLPGAYPNRSFLNALHATDVAR